MPVYEYKCRDCGQISELLIRGSSKTNTMECSACKSTNMERIFSVPSLQKFSTPASGHTCCGRTERCDSPPCSSGESCCRD